MKKQYLSPKLSMIEIAMEEGIATSSCKGSPHGNGNGNGNNGNNGKGCKAPFDDFDNQENSYDPFM